MKIPKQLNRRNVLAACVVLFLIGVGGALVYQGKLKTGISPDETVTKSEKKNRKGAIVETITTTTYEDAKTLWDWFSVLIVPALLTYLAVGLQQSQQKQADEQTRLEKEIADSLQREEAVQAYLDRVASLLVEKNLLAIAARLENLTGKGDREQQELLNASVNVIRARTLSTLRRLGEDKERKTAVIQFLIEVEVISKLRLDLSSANLSGTNLSIFDLSGVNLIGADLRGANLIGADLSDAKLANADLSDADLRGAILCKAKLSKANLSFANLSFANLSGADLTNADFSDADLKGAEFANAILIGTKLCNTTGLTTLQLEKSPPPFLCAVVLPKEMTTVDRDRDCDQLPQVLQEQYPGMFRNIEEASVFVQRKTSKPTGD